MNGHYKLNDLNEPVAVSPEDYYKWQRSLPETHRTGIGFQLKRTETESATVSTVFLGMDHGYGSSVPVLWETMLFCDGENNEDFERSATIEKALEVHESFCRKYL